MREAYRKLNDEERKSESGQALLAQIKATDAEIKKLDASIGNHQRNVGNYSASGQQSFRTVAQEIRMLTGVTGSLPAPLQRVVTGMHSMTGAARKFIATPIGAVIAAIVVAVQALTGWFKKSEIGQLAFAKASGYVGGVLKVFEKIVIGVGDAIYNAFSNPKEAVINLWNTIKKALVDRLSLLGDAFKAIGDIISGGFRGGYKELWTSLKALGKQVTLDVTAPYRAVGRSISKINEEGKKGVKISTERHNIDKEIEKIQDRRLDLEKDGNKNKKELNELRKQELDLIDRKIALEEKAGNKEKVRELKRQRNSMLNTGVGKTPKTPKTTKKEVYDATFDIEQARITALKDGYEKEKAQIELNHKKRLDDIKKRAKELTKAERELLEKYSKNQMDNELAKLDANKAKKDNEKLQRDKDFLIQYLKEFGGFHEKRLAISEKYDDKILKSKSKNEKKLLEAQRKRALSEIDIEEFKASINFADMFANVNEKSTETIIALRNKLAAFIKNASESLTPEQLKPFIDALARADDIIEKRKNPYVALISGIGEAKVALKKYKNAKDENLDVKDVEKYANAFRVAMKSVGDSMIAVSENMREWGNLGADFLAAFNDDTADVADNLIDIAEGGGQVGAGIAKMFAGDVVGGIKDVIKGLTGVVSGIVRINDKVKEKKIQKLQKQVEDTERAYELLGEQIDNAYGKDASKLIEDSNKLLENQKKLILLQIKEEEAKKKTDKAKIEAWKRELKT